MIGVWSWFLAVGCAFGIAGIKCSWCLGFWVCAFGVWSPLSVSASSTGIFGYLGMSWLWVLAVGFRSVVILILFV